MAGSRIGITASGAVLMLALSACGSDESEGTDTSFESAMESCVAGAAPSDVRIDDGGRELRINNKGELDNSGIPLDDVWCLLAELEVTEEIVDRMVETSGNDGEQTASWGPYSVTWTYNPNRGLDVFVVR
jgi:hypothetical protein